jgi:hypothetical protein
MKKLILAGVLTLSSLSILSAKTYEIMLASPTKVGSIQLKQGQYKLKIEGSNAVFTDMDSSKSYTTPVKVQTTDKKFDDTRVQSTKDGNTDRVDEIDLGGTKTKLGF